MTLKDDPRYDIGDIPVFAVILFAGWICGIGTAIRWGL